MYDRDAAWALLEAHNKDEMHLKHALAVEAAMRHFARKGGEDEETWGLAGLLHDLDFEEHPEDHPNVGGRWLTEAGWPESIVRAVLAHGWEYSGVKPETSMEKTIYAVDELTGLVIASALVRPGKSLADLETKSVKKKWKDKSFARGVNREVIQRGADLLGVPVEELITDTIEALRPVEREVGLGE
jgi:putative nucleotidyltransferase with HDIG domain